MPCYLGAVTQRTIVANSTIVTYMTVSQYPATFSHYSFPFIAGTAVNGNEFTDHTIIANLYCCFFTRILFILGLGTNNRTRKNFTVLPDSGSLLYGNIGAYPGSFSYFHIGMNNCKRVYFNIGRHLSVRMYV